MPELKQDDPAPQGEAPNILAPSVSPLTEADPTAINEFIEDRVDHIFNRPPLLLNDAELAQAVEYYRKDRVRFMQEAAIKASKPPGQRRSAKVPTSVADALASSVDLL